MRRLEADDEILRRASIPAWLNRDFTAVAPNRTWVMDYTYVRTWAGFVYVAFVLDVFDQRIVASNIDLTKAVELVDVPVRMAL